MVIIQVNGNSYVKSYSDPIHFRLTNNPNSAREFDRTDSADSEEFLDICEEMSRNYEDVKIVAVKH